MILISNDFWHKIQMYNFEPYNVLLAIATNIAVLLMTASVLQRHILTLFLYILHVFDASTQLTGNILTTFTKVFKSDVNVLKVMFM